MLKQFVEKQRVLRKEVLGVMCQADCVVASNQRDPGSHASGLLEALRRSDALGCMF